MRACVCVIELVHVLVTVSSMRMRALSLHGYVCVYVCLYVLTGACLWLCDCVRLVYSICACVRVCVLHMHMCVRAPATESSAWRCLQSLYLLQTRRWAQTGLMSLVWT